MTDPKDEAIRVLILAGQRLVESHGHIPSCQFLRVGKAACTCNSVARVSEARESWRDALQHEVVRAVVQTKGGSP